MTETVADIVNAHRAGRADPAETVARAYARLRAYDDPALFITVRDEAEAIAEARALAAAGGADKPLFGVPVAVKDNIDVAGLPTTAACPAFAYTPQRDATAVARLRAAGAIVIGKTNLDQFATGLVGVRSPYGTPRNPHDAALVPGGSSSGSAVAVAAGIVPLALGTDTAGSGRVPAGLNNIVGLKPSLGLVPATGVVPACRSLDTISVFALTTDDAHLALAAMAGVDAADAFSRAFPPSRPGPLAAGLRIGVPRHADRVFFGDARAETAYLHALEIAAALGATLVDVDMAPFYATARLLYDGPWVAERFAAVGEFMARHPDAVHPVTNEIVLSGSRPTAVDAFQAFYKLQALRVQARETLGRLDMLMVPTAPAAYTVAELEAEPIRLNSNLGTYTNFVNLLDMAGLAVPAAIAEDGTPFGVTLLAPAGRDAALASFGRVLHARTGLPLGALGVPQPELRPLPATAAEGEFVLAAVGAHLTGLPLNHELTGLGGRYLETTRTAADYRLFALPGTTPPKPGLLRVAAGSGGPIEVELWALTAESFGRFVAAVPSPLSIGNATLADGRVVKCFLVEAEAVAGARDITAAGGWRAFLGKTS
ncbi:allophanate hydrolase [Rhodoplanes sp. TEM]|uniref:Allophanate hydrolase n=1 Tax=Rhodoplanes tepidamans TaxID=200616 RepID=A0ABT5JE06_RHOTP|nr:MULTISPECIES: allophanate hydrolase [Rhodoplanes]MDC7787842.1 allophanate hydrolase [Rhodoplanes tepidamans]MDC7984488.1 allophanate hydrolase [Rhodoplanes sp. TEM]MDQ0357896.1 allophanate hydrolase [Rhodoplanes tepidamans]